MKKKGLVMSAVLMLFFGSLSLSGAEEPGMGDALCGSVIMLAQASPPKTPQGPVQKPLPPAKPVTVPTVKPGTSLSNTVPLRLNIIKPDAATKWCIGTQQTIQWSGNLPAAANLKIELLNSTGSLFKVVAASAPNTGSYSWDIKSAQYAFGEGTFKLRISALDGSVQATTPATFQLGIPLYVTAPKSNYTWRKGSSYQIAWRNGCGISSTALKIDLLNSGKQLVLNIASSVSLNQGYQWTVPTNLTKGTYYMRLTTTDNLYTAESSFQIDDPPAGPVANPQLVITQPDGSSKWCIGDTYTIQWTSTLAAATNLKIELLTATNAPFKVIAASTANSGSYAFYITPQDYVFGSGTFRLKIANPDGSIFSVTPNFQIGRQLFINAPKSNYTWRKGSSYWISWTNGCSIAAATVKIELLDNAKTLVQTIVSSQPLNQGYQWTVPSDLAVGVYYMRVTTGDGLFSAETSFTVGDPV